MPASLPAGEVVAISCGRELKQDSPQDRRGRPKLSHLADGRVPATDQGHCRWHNDWIVSWLDAKTFGIVARLPIERGVLSSREARSPEAIRLSFLSFLDVVAASGGSVAHVQLLAAGSGRVFHPWVSLVQMARAYGQWCKSTASSVRVVLYVVAPDVVMLLNGGYLDLTEHLEDAPIRISVEVIDFFGTVQTHHRLVDPCATLGSLSVLAPPSLAPRRVYALPRPQLRSVPMGFDEVQSMQLRDFGLVSGSTLVFDYRPVSPA